MYIICQTRTKLSADPSCSAEERAPGWVCSFVFCCSAFICRSVNSLSVYWQLPAECIATAKRDKPCCSSLPIASVFHLKQTLNHRNQQFVQRSMIRGFQKPSSTVTLHWNTGNHSSAVHVSITVSKIQIWQSTFGDLGTEGKLIFLCVQLFAIYSPQIALFWALLEAVLCIWEAQSQIRDTSQTAYLWCLIGL